jgi:hypothetical protein
MTRPHSKGKGKGKDSKIKDSKIKDSKIKDRLSRSTIRIRLVSSRPIWIRR